MRSSYASGRGATLVKTPNHRQQATRRRLTVVCAVLGLAIASGVIGAVVRPAAELPRAPATGPFSYFPSE